MYNCFFLIMSPKWSTWHAIHSCNCHWRLTIASRPAFISGPKFDPDVLFRPLRWWYSELNCNRHIATSVVSCASCSVMVYFPITITGMYCMQGRTLKRCKFYDVKGNTFSAILLLTFRNFLRFFNSAQFIKTVIWKLLHCVPHSVQEMDTK